MQINTYEVGQERPLFFIAGPCAIEHRDHALRCAAHIAAVQQRIGRLVIYKSSFDKANRTSAGSFRGVGIEEGLRILEDVRTETGLPVLTDIHTPEQAAAAAQVVDVIQTPAFLARQTDLIQAAAATGKPVNIKKAQFMAPADMRHVVDKARAVGGQVMCCERGTMFGYGNLTVDMRGLPIMAETTRCPVVFDATHSTQLPSAAGGKSGGERRFVPTLARAAVAVGVSGVFMETHPDPDNAPCDGPNSWPLDRLEHLMRDLVGLDALVKGRAIRE